MSWSIPQPLSAFYSETGHSSVDVPEIQLSRPRDIRDRPTTSYNPPNKTVLRRPLKPGKYRSVISGEWIKAKSMSMLEEQDF